MIDDIKRLKLYICEKKASLFDKLDSTQERERQVTFLFVKRMSYIYKCVTDEQ